MTIITNSRPLQQTSVHFSTRILTLASACWLVVATAGQWLFGTYILLFYGKTSLSGDFEYWNKVLPHGYLAGDWAGNLVVIVYILLAAINVFCGPLQLIPYVRQNFPHFHRWLGRIYVTTAIVVSMAGLVMVWTVQRHFR